MERTVEGLIARVDHLKTFSSVVEEINSLIASESASMRDIAIVIEKDPSISAMVLRLANSSYYGLAQKVSSITTALSVLGLQTLKGLVGTASILKIFTKSTFTVFRPQDLWLHSLGCASACRVLARKVNAKIQEEAFMAGLLHDIGTLVLLETVPSDMERVMEGLAAGRYASQVDAEREIVGFSHAEVGSAIALRWHFPEPLVHAIRYHHSAEAASARVARPPSAGQDPSKGMLTVTALLGDQVAKALAMGRSPDPKVSPIGEDVWSLTGIPPAGIMEIMEEAVMVYEELSESLPFDA